MNDEPNPSTWTADRPVLEKQAHRSAQNHFAVSDDWNRERNPGDKGKNQQENKMDFFRWFHSSFALHYKIEIYSSLF